MCDNMPLIQIVRLNERVNGGQYMTPNLMNL